MLVYKNVEVYDVLTGKMLPYEEQQFAPIFFENGRYEVIILPKTDEHLIFYHEYPEFREAVSKISRRDILTGTLHFRNEVGLTSFEIRGNHNRRLLDVVLEIFPTKLDYKRDYKVLLDEVNEEIYNLAYHFIKRTYLQGSAKVYKEPSLAEFYRLIDLHFEQYMKSIDRVEKVSHHQLMKNYMEVRGDKLRRQDQKSLSYLRKNAGKFVDIPNGIPINGRTVMPTKGLLMKKEHTADTHENRYVKWTMLRVVTRLKDLKRLIESSYMWGYSKVDNELLSKLELMIEQTEKRKKNAFWQEIGKLDRSVMSLVLQMAPGYRDILQVYTTISKSIVLQGEIYKMSIKDIATLYEYWTFLKLGQLLAKKCRQVSQDIVKVNTDGLFVNLDRSRTAERKYIHSVTGEEIILKYQFDTTSNRVPTVQQKPDSMLSIGKNGKDYQYQYIFDAKYRLDLESYSVPGPMQDDINTMHRYRDSIVVNSDGRYERTAFGAYVLFPWNEEIEYEQHPLYRSIESVNIGAFPFLPNATTLVDQFIDGLLNKSPEQLQQEGILPKGAMEPVNLYSTDYVLICAMNDDEQTQLLLKGRIYKLRVVDLQAGWQRIRYIAVYEKVKQQISYFAEVVIVDIEGEYVFFKVSSWKPKVIIGNGYQINNNATVYTNYFFQAKMLVDLHSKTEEEFILWKIVNRISNEVKVNLDHEYVDQAKKVVSFSFANYVLEIKPIIGELWFTSDDFKEVMQIALIRENESYVFKRMVELIYPSYYVE